MNKSVAFIFIFTGFIYYDYVFAADEPEPIARFTYGSEDCHRRIRNMNAMIKYWPPGAVVPPNYYMYRQMVMPFWEFTGDMYYNGCPRGGLVSDKVTAAHWYQRAAIEFVPTAQYKLGRMMIEGDGIPVNVDGGRSWITSAAFEGSTEAAKYLVDAGLPVPESINPTSYTVAARQAKIELESAQTRERALIVSDISRLVVNVASIYVAADVASRFAKPRSTTPVMRRPAYCNAYGRVTSSMDSSTAWFSVSSFCN